MVYTKSPSRWIAKITNISYFVTVPLFTLVHPQSPTSARWKKFKKRKEKKLLSSSFCLAVFLNPGFTEPLYNKKPSQTALPRQIDLEPRFRSCLCHQHRLHFRSSQTPSVTRPPGYSFHQSGRALLARHLTRAWRWNQTLNNKSKSKERGEKKKF